jgi:hypothetical protein
VRELVLLALLTALPYASAQRTIPASRFAPQRSAGSSRFFRNSVPFFTSPFFSDSLYYDDLHYNDLLRSGYPVASQPPLIIVQPAAPSPRPEQASMPVQPLLIELQGDRYVRLSGAESSGAEIIDRESGSPTSEGQTAAHGSVQQPAPAVLVFRDGHREEVSEYSITNGVLYANGNYYADGSWNRKIELSTLNLPETLDANRSRSVQFKLPTAPNEVIVGP